MTYLFAFGWMAYALLCIAGVGVLLSKLIPHQGV